MLIVFLATHTHTISIARSLVHWWRFSVQLCILFCKIEFCFCKKKKMFFIAKMVNGMMIESDKNIWVKEKKSGDNHINTRFHWQTDARIARIEQQTYSNKSNREKCIKIQWYSQLQIYIIIYKWLCFDWIARNIISFELKRFILRMTISLLQLEFISMNERTNERGEQ